MAKKKTIYECIECGYKSAKWMGKCPACGAWESFVEVSEGKSVKKRDGFEQTQGALDQMTGRTESNKIVHFPSRHAKIGDIINIRIEQAYPHSLWGYPAGALN